LKSVGGLPSFKNRGTGNRENAGGDRPEEGEVAFTFDVVLECWGKGRGSHELQARKVSGTGRGKKKKTKKFVPKKTNRGKTREKGGKRNQSLSYQAGRDLIEGIFGRVEKY